MAAARVRVLRVLRVQTSYDNRNGVQLQFYEGSVFVSAV